jgi:hypothetical protein
MILGLWGPLSPEDIKREKEARTRWRAYRKRVRCRRFVPAWQRERQRQLRMQVQRRAERRAAEQYATQKQGDIQSVFEP